MRVESSRLRSRAERSAGQGSGHRETHVSIPMHTVPVPMENGSMIETAIGLPRGYGPPPARAVLTSDPGDFRVTEIEKIRPCGEGTHAWLRVRKRGVNTEEVAATLARLAGAPRSAVGFAGMKDRLAVAVQWFSVDLAGCAEPRWAALDSETIEVLEVVAHRRKLRRGTLLGNRFEIVLRDATVSGAGFEERLAAIRSGGIPNYFGPQRFGRDGANLRLAHSLLVDRRRIRDRYRRGLALSAARALVFNRVLAARVQAGVWSAPVTGDVMMLDGRGSVFGVERVDGATVERAARGEIHPTGPLWGRGTRLVTGVARDIEDRVAGEVAPLCGGMERERLSQARRALRVNVRALDCRIEPEGCMTLAFTLPPGAYATTVLRELFSLERFRQSRDHARPYRDDGDRGTISAGPTRHHDS